jgi:hypothetical protein
MTTLDSNDTDRAARKQRGRPFPKGVSGNPAGRQKGSRNQYSEAFIKAYADDFERHGASVIKQVRTDHPVEWLKIGQKLFTAISPKDIQIDVQHHNFLVSTVTDYLSALEAYKKAREFLGIEDVPLLEAKDVAG